MNIAIAPTQNRVHDTRRNIPPPSASLPRPCAVVQPQKLLITSLTEGFLVLMSFSLLMLFSEVCFPMLPEITLSCFMTVCHQISLEGVSRVKFFSITWYFFPKEKITSLVQSSFQQYYLSEKRHALPLFTINNMVTSPSRIIIGFNF